MEDKILTLRDVLLAYGIDDRRLLDSPMGAGRLASGATVSAALSPDGVTITISLKREWI
jgi:hypothetical protein